MFVEGTDISLEFNSNVNYTFISSFVHIARYDKLLQATFTETGMYILLFQHILLKNKDSKVKLYIIAEVIFGDEIYL